MARFEHLPLYHQGYRQVKMCFRLLEKMPRGHKKSLGERIVQSAMRQVQLVVYINSAHNKEKPLVQLVMEIENLALLLRLATDLKAISLGEGQQISENLFEIRKQTQAWRAWVKKKQKTSTCVDSAGQATQRT